MIDEIICKSFNKHVLCTNCLALPIPKSPIFHVLKTSESSTCCTCSEEAIVNSIKVGLNFF